MAIEIESNYKPVIWDKVANCFRRENSYLLEYAPAKENFEVVWPVLENVLHNQLGWREEINHRVCDFGCGTGCFANQLCQMKFHTFACDISKEMIAQAESLNKKILYTV